MKLYIGCSGYYYESWDRVFYPKELTQKEWLSYYAVYFNSVEINHSFYKLPKKTQLKEWDERTPDHFRFSMKGSRYISHMKKIKNVEPHVEKFYKTIEDLSHKIKWVLWQLPGNQHKDLEKLKIFLDLLPEKYNNVIEFRHPSWWDKDVYDAMKNTNTGFCMLSSPANLPEKIIQTADFAYLRLHGKKDWYNYHYNEEELKKWVNELKELTVNELGIFFNNDQHAYALENAQKLQEIFK